MEISQPFLDSFIISIKQARNTPYKESVICGVHLREGEEATVCAACVYSCMHSILIPQQNVVLFPEAQLMLLIYRCFFLGKDFLMLLPKVAPKSFAYLCTVYICSLCSYYLWSPPWVAFALLLVRLSVLLSLLLLLFSSLWRNTKRIFFGVGFMLRISLVNNCCHQEILFWFLFRWGDLRDIGLMWSAPSPKSHKISSSFALSHPFTRDAPQNGYVPHAPIWRVHTKPCVW